MTFPQENETKTYAEYLKQGEDVQYEGINGEIFNMTGREVQS
ncbi:hypothetical protein [Bacillus andreraoultii]|nr:hypothetical protein [Bacillus andreraoultii]